MPLALFALMLSAFAIGTTEFVIVGLIPTVAQDLSVSLPSAGLLVSLYALGVAVGAPILTALTGRVPRKNLLLGLMLLFTIGNLVAWQSPNYTSLIIARILTGLAHGVFFSIGSTIATSLVPREKAASAIALMFTGLTVALVTGVPLGMFIGQHFGWRMTFLAVAALGLLAFVGSLIFIPKNITHTPPASVAKQLAVLHQPRLVMVYAMTALGYGGTFLAFTYLVSILQTISGFSMNAVNWIVLIYGISTAVGNIWGGRLADKLGPTHALQIIFAILAMVLLAFTFAAPYPWLALAVVVCWGAVAFGNVPGLQVYVVKQAERFTPEAVDVASGLNIAAFNLGIASGAWVGGLIVAHFGLIHTAWVGALVVLLALGLTTWSGRLDRAAGIDLKAKPLTAVAAH